MIGGIGEGSGEEGIGSDEGNDGFRETTERVHTALNKDADCALGHQHKLRSGRRYAPSKEIPRARRPGQRNLRSARLANARTPGS